MGASERCEANHRVIQRCQSAAYNTEEKALQTAVADMLLRTLECRGASAQDTGHSRVSISRMTMYWMAAESCSISRTRKVAQG